MKKFITSIPDGGLKFYNRFLGEILGDEIHDALNGLIEDFKDTTEGFVLKGGQVTGTSPNAQINDTIIALDGKICRLVPTTGLTYPFYIARNTRFIQEDYENGSSQNTIFENYAECLSSAPVSGQYVTVTESGNYRKGLSNRIVEDNNTVLRHKVIEIGDWDMDTNGNILVAHSLDHTKIRSINAIIRNDAGSQSADISYDSTVVGQAQSGSVSSDATNIILVRADGGFFDNANFSTTSYNRGWITILYEDV